MSEPVAVVGLGCRFPGAAGPDEFWRLLHDGEDAIGEVPADRWDPASWYHPAPEPGRTNTRHGGHLDGISLFDPDAFGLSPREAEQMDPQQRLVLEVAWEALERAGISPADLAGTEAAVFLGAQNDDYRRMMGTDPTRLDLYSALGTSTSQIANRVSYVLDLRGPSITVDTACSSALVSVHLALQSLRGHECDLALAGGVNVILDPAVTVAMSQAKLLSPQGRTRVFAAEADGYVRGEGCGIVVLRRLSDALRDGDPVLAVLRGSAVNQGGRAGGAAAPSGPAYEALVRRALRVAGVAGWEIGYVEAASTANTHGDPIEVAALTRVLAEGREDGDRCGIGSVKPNIGHLESASGAAALLKVILSLRHEEIPAHLYLDRPNPYLELDESRFFIPTAPQAWPRGDRPRTAGVSNSGIGGTNAHVIVQEAPVRRVAPAEPEHGPELLCLSARTPELLRELVGRYLERLPDLRGHRLVDICHTANSGRVHRPYRLAVRANDLDEMLDRLRAHLDDPGSAGPAGKAPSRRPKVALALHGGGPDAGALADAVVGRHVLARQVIEWGIVPDLLIGHGVGELVAACLAGLAELADVVGFVRSRQGADAPVLGDLAADRPLAGAPRTPLLPASTGRVVPKTAAAGPDFWRRQLVPAPTRDIDRMTTVAGCRLVLELGAGGVALRYLSTSDARHDPGPAGQDRAALLDVLGQLYIAGVPVDWRAVNRDRAPVRVELPVSPYERRRFWFAPPGRTPAPNGNGNGHPAATANPLLGARRR